MYICMCHVCASAFALCMYMDMCVFACVSACVCMYVCMYVCVCTCMCISSNQENRLSAYHIAHIAMYPSYAPLVTASHGN